MTDGPYNPSGVLYRKALASAESAKRIASGEKSVAANPRAREADACIVAVVLAHAAVESAWHWEQSLAGIGTHKWPGEFEAALAEVAEARERPKPSVLDEPLKQLALRLNAWRNFLQHGDASSRAALEAMGDDVPESLRAELATEAVQVAKALMDHIAQSTGGQIMTGPALWVDPSEL